jgi:hypothetical protein
MVCFRCCWRDSCEEGWWSYFEGNRDSMVWARDCYGKEFLGIGSGIIG